jgi:hypothetical protein
MDEQGEERKVEEELDIIKVDVKHLKDTVSVHTTQIGDI